VFIGLDAGNAMFGACASYLLKKIYADASVASGSAGRHSTEQIRKILFPYCNNEVINI
jgi:hypothetical protein